MRVEPYFINPDDPRAPPREVWERLTDEERLRVRRSLPAQFPLERFAPEGMPHFSPPPRLRSTARR